MDGETQSAKKKIDSCIYCPNPPDGQEHWLNRSLGKFEGNTFLTGRICTPCNIKLGGTIDLELARSAHTGLTRQLLGIEGRAGHERKNVFEYKASQKEPPLQIFRVHGEDLKPILEQAVRRNSDGTLVSTHGRVLVIETETGREELRFPRGWSEKQLRAAAETRGLLHGRPVSAHVAPPETIDEFLAASLEVIRAVFGRHPIDVYHSRLDGPIGSVEPTLVRFNLSLEFVRSVAKVGFHYFLWACPAIGGDEPEFSAIKAFIRDGDGKPSDFVNMVESMVDRTPAEGAGRDCHVFAATCADSGVVAQVHFFSQSVGPQFPTFVVKLGQRPASLVPTWRRGHVAAYIEGIAGHDGTLRELAVA